MHRSVEEEETNVLVKGLVEDKGTNSSIVEVETVSEQARTNKVPVHQEDTALITKDEKTTPPVKTQPSIEFYSLTHYHCPATSTAKGCDNHGRQ